MKTYLVLAISFAIAAVCLVASPATAQPACNGVCNPLMDCRMPCWPSGTCANYGSCNQDPDNDGIAWLQDNCPLNYNPTQADCDSDGIGDPCDSHNEVWVKIQDDNNICSVDYDLHTGYFTIEFHSKEIYQNQCGSGGTCVNTVKEAGKNCTLFFVDRWQCCESLAQSKGYPLSLCDGSIPRYFCGTPECSF